MPTDVKMLSDFLKGNGQPISKEIQVLCVSVIVQILNVTRIYFYFASWNNYALFIIGPDY